MNFPGRQLSTYAPGRFTLDRTTPTWRVLPFGVPRGHANPPHNAHLRGLQIRDDRGRP